MEMIQQHNEGKSYRSAEGSSPNEKGGRAEALLLPKWVCTLRILGTGKGKGGLCLRFWQMMEKGELECPNTTEENPSEENQ